MNRYTCFLRLTRMRPVLVGVLALMLATLAVAAPGLALAHAKLVSSTPADGSSIGAGLTEIVLTFSEEISVDQSSATLLGPNGTAVAGASASVDRANRTVMRIQTPALQPGKYTVSWEAVTEDDNGHTTGSLSFTVMASGQAPAIGDTASQGTLPGTGAGDLYPYLLALVVMGALTVAAGAGLRALARKAGAVSR